jgi:Ni/Co efflux regulator RcnB
MKKTLLAALIAATALVPPAFAQDRGGRWGGGGDRSVGTSQRAPQTRNWSRWNNGAQRQGVAGAQQFRSDRNDGGRFDRSDRTRFDRGNRGWNGNRTANRNWNGGNVYRGDRSGRWDNGWRNDRRYDWRGYRTQNRSLYRLPRYYAPSGWSYGYRRFTPGFQLSALLYSSNYWINDPFSYRLPEVDGPYRWVRYYNDALLVDTYTGEVVDTIYDIFW